MSILNTIKKYFASGRRAKKHAVSAIIPVLNEAANLAILLPALIKQKNISKIELIIVDSGSTDASVNVAIGHGAKVIRIPNSSFSHDKARNIGAKAATRELLLFITADALPPNDSWLDTMISMMDEYGTDAVSCREAPRKDAELFSRIGTWHHNRFMDIDWDDRIMKLPKIQDYETLRYNAQLNNVACVIRRKVFNKFRFNIGFAEDLELGLRLIKAGHKCAMLGTTHIVHSHNRTMYYHLKRTYIDSMILSRIFDDFDPGSVRLNQLLNELPYAVQLVRLTAEKILSSPMPCRPRDLSDNIVSFMVRKKKELSRWNISPEFPSLFDEDFNDFMRRHWGRMKIKGYRPQRNGLLVALIHDINRPTRRYLDIYHKTIDNSFAAEYEAHLLKLLAAKLGAMLAAAYINGNSSERKAMAAINKELFDMKVMWSGKMGDHDK